MREESLLISEELFNALAPVSGDLDWQYVWSLVLISQDKQIQPVIGQKLYEKLMADIQNDTLEEPYVDLLEDYIARTLVWFTCSEGFPFWSIKVVNSGIVQRIVDDGSIVDLTDVQSLAKTCRLQGEFYQQRLTEFLCANSKDFPEYTVCDSGEMGADATNYQGGLNLDDSGRGRRNRSNGGGGGSDCLKGWL